jgi:hypothetical protein
MRTMGGTVGRVGAVGSRSTPIRRTWIWVVGLGACAPTLGAPAPGAATERIDVPALPRVLNLDAVAAGDLDGDGDLDLVTSRGVPLYNDGVATFTNGTLRWLGSDGTPFSSVLAVTVADMDGDGIADVVAHGVTRGTYTIDVAFGSAAGVRDGTPILGFSSSQPEIFHVGDTNDDGAAELAVRITDPRAAELYGFLDLSSGFDVSSLRRVEPGRPTHVGDVDGDGVDDLAIGAVAPHRSVVWQAGASGPPGPREQGPSPYGPGYPDPTWPIVADWEWTTFEGQDDAAMANPQHGARIAGPGDVDGDGHADLVVVNAAAATWLSWFAGGPGGFGERPTGELVASAADDLSAARVVGADLDGDGVREVVASVVVHQQVLLLVFEPGPGRRTPVRVLDPGFLPTGATLSSLVSPGDLDGDGYDDLLADGRVLFGGEPACGAAQDWYLDSDGDGHVSDAHVVRDCAAPPGASPVPGGDCDDADPAVFPGAVEVMGHDDRGCDGVVWCYGDDDHDGWGGPPRPIEAFTCGDQFPRAWRDCDDTDPNRTPDHYEIGGNDIDDDCDGRLTCYADLDGDGLGSAPVYVRGTTCADPAGGVSPNALDCDDTDGAGIERARLYQDQDGDGYGAGWLPYGCTSPLPPGVSLRGDDCADYDPDSHPGGQEVPGHGDEDCDGLLTCYEDWDRDGVGGPVSTRTPPDGLYVDCEHRIHPFQWLADDGGDCDDRDPLMQSGRTQEMYRDADGDGWGGARIRTCPRGRWVTEPGDCDDDDRQAWPGAPEFPSSGSDQNCDGLITCYADRDDDGIGDLTQPYVQVTTDCDTAPFVSSYTDDCDDANANVWPGNVEDPADGLDNNCNSFLGPALAVYPTGNPLQILPRDRPMVFQVWDFPPGEPVRVVRSTRGPGPGPCPPGYADCVGLLSPSWMVDVAVDEAGAGVATERLRGLGSGTQVWFQAISPTGFSEVERYVTP